MVFIREKKIDCAEYREVDIIPRTEAAEQASRGKRGKKRKAVSYTHLTLPTILRV